MSENFWTGLCFTILFLALVLTGCVDNSKLKVSIRDAGHIVASDASHAVVSVATASKVASSAVNSASSVASVKSNVSSK